MKYQLATKKSEMRHHEQGRGGQVGAETAEHALEGRHHPDHDHRRDDERHAQDRHRVEQRRLDLGLDRQRLFLVDRQAGQQVFQDTGLFAGADQVAEQRVEVQRELAEGLVQAGAGLDIAAHVLDQLGHRRVRVALADDVERLQQRHAGLHHRRQLAGEQRDVLVGDLLAAAQRPFLDLGDQDALAAQRDVDDVLAAGAQFAAHRLPACPCLPRRRAIP